ncbi:hypothetical protein ColTof4_11473 [Colletotrichum tofieldiae]|nr:hypothetical protein ColTof4_11473 [Colletotrichum tofieldiae]
MAVWRQLRASAGQIGTGLTRLMRHKSASSLRPTEGNGNSSESQANQGSLAGPVAINGLPGSPR